MEKRLIIAIIVAIVVVIVLAMYFRGKSSDDDDGSSSGSSPSSAGPSSAGSSPAGPPAPPPGVRVYGNPSFLPGQKWPDSSGLCPSGYTTTLVTENCGTGNQSGLISGGRFKCATPNLSSFTGCMQAKKGL